MTSILTTTTLTASTEAQLNADIAQVNAAGSGAFVIDILGPITENVALTTIKPAAGVSVVVNASNGSGGVFTLDGGGTFGGIAIAAGSTAEIENIALANIPAATPALLAGGTLGGTVTVASSAVVDQTGSLTFGDASGPGIVTNHGTFEIDQLASGASGPGISGVAGSTLVSDGLLIKENNANDFSGISEIFIDVVDTGTISVTDSNSNLRLSGPSNAVSGTYIGGGMIDYGDPVEQASAGNDSYSVTTIGALDMSDSACTTTWGEVDQTGAIVTSLYTSITNFGHWNFTSDVGIGLETPALASGSVSAFNQNGGVVAKTGGTGTSTIGINFGDNAGTVSIASGTLAFNGLGNDFFGLVTGAGVLSMGGGGSDIVNTSTAFSTAGWTVTGAGTDVTLDAPMTYAGAFALGTGATLTLTGANNLTLAHATFGGTVTSNGTAAIGISAGGTLEIDDLTRSVSGAQVQNFNAPISGYANGDLLRLLGFGGFATINGVTPAFNSGANTTSLALKDNGSLVATLTLTGNHTNVSVIADPLVSGAVDVVCYASGTRVLTPDGERPVDDLAPGDQVMTLVDGRTEARAVRWVGSRRIDLMAHPRPDSVAPIRILAGAFTDQVPVRDLLVSPDHGVLVDGMLICARQLVNGMTVVQDLGFRSIEYVHVELDAHGILLAEGLPAESYLDTGNRGFFSNAAGPLVLHPDLSAPPPRDAGSCVPFVDDAARVAPVWHRLAERAAVLGHQAGERETTADPAPTLLVDGLAVRPLVEAVGTYVFAIAGAPAHVRLLSRAAAPTDTRPWLSDRRLLGLPVTRILLRESGRVREIPVDHPGLAAGWWRIEAGHRWTNGDATIPLPVTTGPVMLEIHVRPDGLLYPAERSRSRHAA
jgi:Hint domain